MIEDAEIAGELFLKAGVIENSRFAWNLASQFYSETYNYARLSSVYIRLASVVASKVPVVDTNNQLELSSSLGRFYRVWFHGGDTDLLIGTEFVHRVPSRFKLEEFGNHIKGVIKSLLPVQTPIDLVLDDGRPEETPKRQNKRITAGTAFEPIKIKVTPLRPMVKGEIDLRGSPEWFNNHIESPDPIFYSKRKSNTRTERDKSKPKSSSLTIDSDYRSYSTAGSYSNVREHFGKTGSFNFGLSGDPPLRTEGGSLIGVDRFHYTQPKKQGRLRGTRDYLKSSTGDFAEKNLRVTQLQVKESFPACVSRQVVINRTVLLQSPLEAGVEAVCSWCAVLFRTAVASNGMAVLGKSNHLFAF